MVIHCFMRLTNYQAGYALNPLFGKNDALLKHLSTFAIQSSIDLKRRSEDSLICILHNLLIRGVPTKPSTFIEDAFASTLQKTAYTVNSIGSIRYELVGEDTKRFDDLLGKAMHIIEPRLVPENISYDGYDHQSEKQFREKLLPKAMGAFASQLIEPQRELDGLLNFDSEKKDRYESILGRYAARFYRQQVDFTLTQPGEKGLVIEIDGKQHQNPDQRELDSRRRGALKNKGWQLARIPANKAIPEMELGIIGQSLSLAYAEKCKENYQNPIWEEPEGMDALQYALSPFAISRIQMALIALIQTETLKLSSKRWRICVFERDVPCAHLAIEDFKQQYKNLIVLTGRKKGLPEIELTVITTPEFRKAGLHTLFQPILIDELPTGTKADVLIDVSILERTHLTGIPDVLLEKIISPANLIIRSAYQASDDRRFLCAKPVKYASFLENFERLDVLRYFLKNIFRKSDFRPGQLEIMERVLQQKDVIGLLPTGAGKSLTYQLAALLQPGITLIVDPIKALMYDQVDNLKRTSIDACCFISSALSRPQRQYVEKSLEEGRYLFVFVSPERLQIQEFRETLLSLKDLYFSYCVIDEAHCVSEWGHDFRTAYLRLAENARKYCKHYYSQVPMAALTGTASFDVLADIQRELGIGSEGVITPPTYERKELSFHILPCKPEQEIMNLPQKEAVALVKKQTLSTLIRSIPSYFGESQDFFEAVGEESKAGLVFCPHVGWEFGVNKVASHLKETLPELNGSIGTFAGSFDSNSPDGTSSQEIQDHFKDNRLNLLVATKAFGMGVDKPNIRYTVHFNMPPSIESFYQEAGRAGRDRKDSHCFILFSDTKVAEGRFGEVTVDKGLMLSFHQNSYRGEAKEIRILMDLLHNPIQIDGDKYPSICNLLDGMSIDEEKEMVIPYENEAIANILSYLQREVHSEFREDHLQEAIRYCQSVGEMLTKARSKLYKDIQIWSFEDDEQETHEKALNDLFISIRQDADMYKAIFRLSLIGLITDYVVNYNTRTITAKIRRRNPDYYIWALTDYISRYVSVPEVKRTPGKIEATEGDSILIKCVHYLVGFIYSNIVRKREEAINIMERAIEHAISGGDFKEYVNSYFDSKYTTVLRPCLYDYSLKTVWEMIEDIKGEPDGLKHLLGATNRLLVENPDNPVLLLLRAFAALGVEINTTASTGDFIKGWQISKRDELSKSLSKDMKRFYTYCLQYHGLEVEEHLGAEILKFHLTWLKDFNKQQTGALTDA